MKTRIWLPALSVAAVLIFAAWGIDSFLNSEGASSVAGAAELMGDAASGADTDSTTTAPETTSTTSTSTTSTTVPPDLLPEGTGAGKRVVLSVSGQRMWWVDQNEQVLRTALVSGRANTPTLGTFEVYSKTLNATGLDGSQMDYFVRFTKGPNGWAIGFHDIPTMGGAPVQTQSQLGTPLSHGCIRQDETDAQFTWEFLDVGSSVVVVA